MWASEPVGSRQKAVVGLTKTDMQSKTCALGHQNRMINKSANTLWREKLYFTLVYYSSLYSFPSVWNSIIGTSIKDFKPMPYDSRRRRDKNHVNEKQPRAIKIMGEPEGGEHQFYEWMSAVSEACRSQSQQRQLADKSNRKRNRIEWRRIKSNRMDR